MTVLCVQGTSSSAGKSLVVTAICASLARRGVDVAPFKASNMSTHARVVDGGEIGVAQWLQARACGLEPDVRMNPVLVKPEAGRSQVVRVGRVDPVATATPWRDRAPLLWPTVRDCLDDLVAEHDVVIAEGAGSPAETNLADVDLANLAVAAHTDAPTLLVADIDRGGAFAHLLGTWELVDAAHRARLAGFVLNRFRGDASLLAPAPADLEARTGMAHVGVLPWLDHGLPDEDGVSGTGVAWPEPGPVGAAWSPRPRVAVVAYPRASNRDELTALSRVTDLTWATQPAQLRGADLVVLPGSKHVLADLAWLGQRGLDRAVRAAADDGTRVLGVCGGYQMLGRHVADPGGVEGGEPGSAAGLGLLDVATTLQADKLTAAGAWPFAALPPPWRAWSGARAVGYEIRMGRTEPTAGAAGVAALPGGRGWARGPVLGVAVHGLLEQPSLVAAALGVTPPPLDDAFAVLADAVDAHLDMSLVDRLVAR